MERKIEVPVAVCKIGSGVLALLAMGAGAGAIAGYVAFFIWMKGPPPAHPEPTPAWLGYILMAIVASGVLALLGMLWWLIRQGLYAKCLRYWHPEIAPPRKVFCPRCKDCERCKGSGAVDETKVGPESQTPLEAS